MIWSRQIRQALAVLTQGGRLEVNHDNREAILVRSDQARETFPYRMVERMEDEGLIVAAWDYPRQTFAASDLGHSLANGSESREFGEATSGTESGDP